MPRPTKNTVTICELTNSDGTPCSRPVIEDIDIAVCSLHALMIAKHLEEHPVELQKPKVRDMSTACVYYLRMGDRIKIGTTIDLPHRLDNIPHEELLAIEPGSYRLEHALHRYFQEERVKGEWFKPSGDLLDHIAGVREKNGHPLDAWALLVENRHGTSK